jgi:hypothetical protein
MTIKKIVLFSALSIAFVAGSAAAQTAGSVNVTSNPMTSSVSSGSGVSIGTLTLSGVQGGGAVTSLPITISASNGGQLGNLSNCQVYNANGTSLTTGTNVMNTVGTGVNTFILNAPLTVNASTGTTTLTIRCDVAAGAQSGSVFTISGGSAVLGPVFRVNLDTAPTVPAGAQNVTLANISVGATGASYNLSSIPLSISASSNNTTSNLTGCAIRDASNLDTIVSTGTVVNNGSASTFNLSVPMLVTAGSANMYALTCSVQPATAVGSTFSISVNPGSVGATNASTGAAVTPVGVPAGGFGPNGLPASTSGTIIVTAVGSATTQPGDTGTIPGVPNTGMGIDLTLMVVALAGIIASAGALYLGRARA